MPLLCASFESPEPKLEHSMRLRSLRPSARGWLSWDSSSPRACSAGAARGRIPLFSLLLQPIRVSKQHKHSACYHRGIAAFTVGGAGLLCPSLTPPGPTSTEGRSPRSYTRTHMLPDMTDFTDTVPNSTGRAEGTSRAAEYSARKLPI